ncbi:MAG: hypothetical protein IJ326_05515 [Lachnospiraceae bacterium]|nr:hypothetical protein [Lachnospiraceae bacterium]
MKKAIIKVVVCIVVFLATLFISSNAFNQNKTDMTSTMGEASLPLVHMVTTYVAEEGTEEEAKPVTEEITFNTLHGLRQEVDGRFYRDTITPLGEGRTLSFSLEKYENTIVGLSFEVRSIDGTRLVESTQITDYRESEDEITATVTIKDLIDKNVEYSWILLVETPEETIRYYTRIIDADEYYTAEKLNFVLNFHEKTFDKEAAKDLIPNLESNSKGDNTKYSLVDIHSSLDQVSWGDLTVGRTTKPDIIISEMEKQTASIRINYQVGVLVDNTRTKYNVSEFYRIRYTTSRVYLLEFERTMNQIFEPDADVYASNKIMLGIRNEEVQMMESEDGNNLAFVNEDQLFCYHAGDKKIASLFGFYEDKDIRTFYGNHDIKILNVDETGGVTFMVYGYMNRGKYEGRIGILIYQYNAALNTIEEQIFIPYNKSYEVLAADIEQLSYVNSANICYLYLDGAILQIDLTKQTSKEIATQLQEDSFQVAESEEMLVWQNSADAYDCDALTLKNLNTGKEKVISVRDNKRLLPLGFIGEDLIYGVAEYEDIELDANGAVTFPMYAVYIQNEQGDILKSYEQTGIYVVDSVVQDNLITLKRVVKTEDEGVYEQTTDDQIINNILEEAGHNSVEIVVTQNYEKIVQLVLKSAIETKSLKVVTPKEILYEGSRELAIDFTDAAERFYVYSKDGIVGAYTHPANAVNLAYELSGTVVDQEGRYIWKKTTRSTRNQIMAIGGTQSDEDTSDLAVCLETILGFAGSVKNAQDMLDKGQTVTEILSENLNDIEVLELRGVSLDAVLYYVNMDIPVLATVEDGSAVLVIGFNELNVVVMNPQNGKVYKVGMNDATKWFAENGNRFVTYIQYE